MSRAKVGAGVVAAAGMVLLAVACSQGTEAGPSYSEQADASSAGSPPAASPVAPTGLPCDVDTILKTRCQTCHSSEPQYGAPIPLVTWNDLHRDASSGGGKKVFELVGERIHSEDRPMPPASQPKLTPEQMASLDGWIAGGAPSSDATCTGAVVAEGVKPLSCTPDTILQAKKPFEMKGNAIDQYICFGVDIDVKKKRHVTAFAPRVDNKDIVHHILLFQTPTASSKDPFPCAAFGSGVWKLVAGWAPGADNLELPPEAGFPEEVGTTHYTLQVHYNASKVKSGTDASGYELCTTDQLRPNDAGIIGLGSMAFDIPPRSTHKIRCDYRLGADFENVTLFNSWPHMHTYGMAMSTERLVGGKGTPEPIMNQQNFSFDAQLNFPISARVAPGDILRTRCAWKNTSDARIGFGEETGDEMCYNFVSYYPNIPDRSILLLPLFTWTSPALYAACQSED